MDIREIDLLNPAEMIVTQFLAVKPGENVLIICDPGSEMRMAYALAGVVQRVGGEYTIAVMPTRDKGRANDLTAVIARGLAGADCLIGMTRFSGAPTYAQAVKERFNAQRLRSISMVMRGVENFTAGGALADYRQLYAEGQRLAELWTGARRIRVTSPAGTDVTAQIGKSAPIVECGFASEPGMEAAFPDGEVSQGPDEGTANGLIAVDGPICYYGVPDQPVALRVEDGWVVEVVPSGRTAGEIADLIKTMSNAGNIAEFGIGLNGWCLRNGDFEEEKKGRGNVHIALGDNIFYGGTTISPVHIDMVLYQPTVYLDDICIVKNGQIVF